MNDEWIGKRVSLNCGGLGFYQGIIASLQLDESTITIREPFQNGVRCQLPSVTLCASDILDLKVLEDKLKFRDQKINRRDADSVVEEEEEATASAIRSSTKKNNSAKETCSSSSAPNSSSAKKNLQQQASYAAAAAATGGHNKKRSSRTFVAEGLGATSANKFNSPVRQTPNSRAAKYNAKDEECFGYNPNQSDDNEEFDFEKNLALFNKQLVFNEIDSQQSNQPDIVKLVDCNVRKPEPKYRNDENVLESGPVVLRQISTGESVTPYEYVTDSGLVVPSISNELRHQLFVNSEIAGISIERFVELMGRGGADLGIQTLGGSHRLDPSNVHQTPKAVLLVGLSKAGAITLSIGRHLAAHGVKIDVYIPHLPSYPKIIKQEFSLYKLTGQNFTHEIKDLPMAKGVDLLVNGLEDHEMYKQERSQPWHRSAVLWASGVLSQSRIPAISVDPPPGANPPFQPIKISLIPGFLPLYHPEEKKTGKLHMVNIGIPKKVYKDLGITYASIYGAKSVVPLHHK